MNKLMMVAGVVVLGAMVTGCKTTKEIITEEYNRITSMPHAKRTVCECDSAINDLGGAACDVRNLAQGYLTAYVKATENHREYVGFMNDVGVLVEDDGLSNEEAMEKVKGIVQHEDENRAEADRVWPKIAEGVAAVDALKPENKLKEIAAATLRNANLVNTASRMQGSFIGFDQTTLAKAGAVKNISVQVAETAECLAFLEEQYRKALVAKFYTK